MPIAYKTIAVWFKNGKFGKRKVFINERDFDSSLYMRWADYQAMPEKTKKPAPELPKKTKTKTIQKEKTVKEPVKEPADEPTKKFTSGYSGSTPKGG